MMIRDLRSPDWSRLHARQVALASALEVQLPEALAAADLNDAVSRLADQLTAAGATATCQRTQMDAANRLAAESDPMPGLLDALLGRSDDRAHPLRGPRAGRIHGGL
jgi:hypothetical protein